MFIKKLFGINIEKELVYYNEHKKKKMMRKSQGNTERRITYEEDSLDSFLNSAMNVEFVYIILLGVKNFMENLE